MIQTLYASKPVFKFTSNEKKSSKNGIRVPDTTLTSTVTTNPTMTSFGC